MLPEACEVWNVALVLLLLFLFPWTLHGPSQFTLRGCTVCRDGSCVLPHTERSRPSNCQNLSVYRAAHTCWWSMNQRDFISSTWLPLTNLIHKEALRVYLLFHCAAWTVFIMKMTHNRTWTLLLHICASVFLISLIHHSTDKSPLVTYKQNTAITLLPKKNFFFKRSR